MRIMSEEHKEKLRKAVRKTFKEGRKPWNKGLHVNLKGGGKWA